MTREEEDPRDFPFRAIVRSDASSTEGEFLPEVDDAGRDNEDEAFGDGFSGDDIEAAYLRALEVTDAALEGAGESLPAEIAESDSSFAEPAPPSAPEAGPALTGEEAESVASEQTPRATPRQVVEALLFVGGAVLTSRKLADLLGEGFSTEQVEEIVDALNADYAAEGRPYLIHWGEGGYRYQLRSVFEKVRNRVFGVGPREVKLSQEALEILALVAYRQPLTSADLEATQRKNAGSLLRQLIRRELVELRRSEAAPDEPTYHTTARFLELFGLTSLDDLPFPADFAFK